MNFNNLFVTLLATVWLENLQEFNLTKLIFPPDFILKKNMILRYPVVGIVSGKLMLADINLMIGRLNVKLNSPSNFPAIGYIIHQK